MLTLFPNYAVLHSQNQLWMEAGTHLLIDDLHEAGVPLAIVAQQHKGNATSGNYLPIRQSDVRLCTVAIVDGTLATWRRLMSYCRQIIPIIRAVQNSDFCYIYIPGHVGLLAVLSCWMLRKPYALYLRGDYFVATPHVFHKLLQKILTKAKFILCTGKKLQNTVESVNPNAEAVVPMSPVLFVKTVEKSIIQPADTFTILFVGQMLRDKGIFELLDAFERIVARVGEKAKLMMVGEGKDKPLFVQQAEKKGLLSHLQCMGLITDPHFLVEVYRRSDVFCLPTYSEGFPRVLYEAMRFSLPIVTTPVGQITTIIQNGKNGLLCSPKSVESLTNKLIMLIEDVSLRRQLGVAGRTTLNPLLEEWRGQTHGHQVLKWLDRSGFPR